MTKMIKCPACSCEVSSQAAACPQCGHLFKSAGAINLRDPVHLVGIALVTFSCSLGSSSPFGRFSRNTNTDPSLLPAQILHADLPFVSPQPGQRVTSNIVVKRGPWSVLYQMRCQQCGRS